MDVAIVGGGLTGATIAWTFAHAGLRVALLESALGGRGSTAANSALLMQEPDNDLGDLTRRYGARAARRIWQLGREATRDFVAVLRRLDIACDLVEPQQRDGIAAVTRRGTVVAKHIVVATGFATPAFKPLAGRFRMKHTYVVATEQISSRVRSRIGLGDLMLWDAERPYHYARWTPDDRLLLGGGDRPQLPSRRRADAFTKGVRALRDHFRRLHPYSSSTQAEPVGIRFADRSPEERTR